MRKLTQEECIRQFRDVHGDTYNYSKFVYTNAITKGIIICKIHGEFKQTPHKHKMGQECRKCGHKRGSDKRIISREKIIRQFRKAHGNIYNYSEFIYNGNNIKGTIICEEHGKFEQTPANHKRENGCPICSGKQLLTLEECIKQFREVHGDIYDYSKFVYINSHTKGIIICKEHGEFKQNPTNHKSGNRCPKCSHIISKPEIAFLDYIGIPKECRQKIIQIGNRRFKLDAKIGNIIIEFYGDFWHGNPKIYKPDDINKCVHKTMGELYEKTLRKERILNEAGYSIVSIWESDWIKMKQELAI